MFEEKAVGGSEGRPSGVEGGLEDDVVGGKGGED